jgi:tRNA threonylcarbamoyladenosine biosynthesis protein TsaE
MSRSCFLPDEAATEKLAEKIALSMPASGAPLILYLTGDLGTGKTSFARGILGALGETGAVRSPTYALVSSHALTCGQVHHLDLYRLESPEELEELALRDLLEDSRLWLVEWPERGAGRLPPADLSLELRVEGPGRRMEIHPLSPVGHQWVAGLSGGSR